MLLCTLRRRPCNPLIQPTPRTPPPLGLQSHYDDADRFSRPIFSLRLFSDSRLSFGTQLYG